MTSAKFGDLDRLVQLIFRARRWSAGCSRPSTICSTFGFGLIASRSEAPAVIGQPLVVWIALGILFARRRKGGTAPAGR